MSTIKTKPDVSVLIAAYNEAAYIEECLKSVLSQEGPSFEVVVVDDQSSDATLEIAKRMAAKDARIRVYETPKKGKVNTFNFAYEMSTGTSIILLGADDILPNNSLLFRYKTICNAGLDAPVAAYGRLKTMSLDRDLHGIEAPKLGRLGNHSGGLAIFSRSLCELMFPIPDHLVSEDAWLGLCVTDCSQQLFYLDNIILHYRIHPGNSVNRYSSFKVVSDRYHLRRAADKAYLDRRSNFLASKRIEALRAAIKLEEARYSGSILEVISCPDTSWKARLKALSIASPSLYHVQTVLSRIAKRLY